MFLTLPEDGLVFDELLKKEGGKAKNEFLSLSESTEGNSVTFNSLVTDIYLSIHR